MRFTNVLFKINYHRHIKRVWKRQGRLMTEELNVPPELIEMGVPIVDAKEILNETKLFKPLKIEKTNTVPVVPSALIQEKCCYVMHSKIRISESENQTLSLTKTMPYEGLPLQLVSLIGHDSLPNQDELVKTSILQSQVWDADQHKLPKIIDFTRPNYVLKRAYGIRHKKKMLSLLEKFTNLLDCATGKYPACLQRSKLIDVHADLTISRKGDLVALTFPCDILLTSKEPLQRFASVAEVECTEQDEVPNIYPIKHTLDLEKVEDLSIHFEPHNFDSGHLHTIFIVQKSFGFWFPKQILARAIATCFTYCATAAQNLYGVNVTVLPEPICVQCVYLNRNSFNFLSYQLNTLDLDHDNGIKNQVWIDDPIPLCESVSETTLITDYNPEVFKKCLALYLNGLVSTDV